MPKAERKLWLSEASFLEMRQLAENHFPLETGGMLLGYEAKNGEAVVTKIIGPGPYAKHGRFRFLPDSKYQQEKLEEHFWTTDGGETYLGDWHTHPKSSPNPSYTDKRTLARIALEPASRITHPIMVILGGEGGTWILGAVRFLEVKRRLLIKYYLVERLRLVSFS